MCRTEYAAGSDSYASILFAKHLPHEDAKQNGILYGESLMHAFAVEPTKLILRRVDRRTRRLPFHAGPSPRCRLQATAVSPDDHDAPRPPFRGSEPASVPASPPISPQASTQGLTLFPVTGSSRTTRSLEPSPRASSTATCSPRSSTSRSISRWNSLKPSAPIPTRSSPTCAICVAMNKYPAVLAMNVVIITKTKILGPESGDVAGRTQKTASKRGGNSGRDRRESPPSCRARRWSRVTRRACGCGSGFWLARNGRLGRRCRLGRKSRFGRRCRLGSRSRLDGGTAFPDQ